MALVGCVDWIVFADLCRAREAHVSCKACATDMAEVSTDLQSYERDGPRRDKAKQSTYEWGMKPDEADRRTRQKTQVGDA